MKLYKADNLSNIRWLEHGFGTRGMTLDYYLRNLGLENAVFARTNQTHGDRVFVLDGAGREGILEGDAFVTNSQGAVCFVRTADCVPILVCDPKNRAVGAIHAGWRGHVCDVIGHAIRTMTESFGSKAQDLLAAVGPSICPSCYDVGGEVVEEFTRNGFSDHLWAELPSKNGYSLDLKGASMGLLVAAGVSKGRIAMLDLCTSCDGGDFASYRREKTDDSRQVNFIYIK